MIQTAEYHKNPILINIGATYKFYPAQPGKRYPGDLDEVSGIFHVRPRTPRTPLPPATKANAQRSAASNNERR